jgi:nucleoid DNA-binding protein
MEQLIEQLKLNAQLDDDQAQKAIKTIVDFIKAKLPPMMHAAVDSFLTDSTASEMEDPLG